MQIDWIIFTLGLIPTITGLGLITSQKTRTLVQNFSFLNNSFFTYLAKGNTKKGMQIKGFITIIAGILMVLTGIR